MKWKNQQMSLFQFYLYIDGSLHILGLQAHPQENSHSCSHNHLFSGCTVQATCSLCLQSTRPKRCSHWTSGCVNSCVNSHENGPVDPKHVEIRQYMNKTEIVTSVGFFISYVGKMHGIKSLKFVIIFFKNREKCFVLPLCKHMAVRATSSRHAHKPGNKFCNVYCNNFWTN
jgi:hypothetical protein